jgi:hypothetical protein
VSAVLDPPAITFDFVRSPDWISRFIAWYGNGYDGCAHVAPRLRDGSYIDARNNAMTVGGVRIPSGVQRRPAGYLDNSVKHIRATKPVSLTQYQAWTSWLVQHLNDGYDEADIFSFITGIPLTNGEGFWVCSALGLGSLQSVHELPQDMPFAVRECTPNSLLWIVASIGFKIIKIR